MRVASDSFRTKQFWNPFTVRTLTYLVTCLVYCRLKIGTFQVFAWSCSWEKHQWWRVCWPLQEKATRWWGYHRWIERGFPWEDPRAEQGDSHCGNQHSAGTECEKATVDCAQGHSYSHIHGLAHLGSLHVYDPYHCLINKMKRDLPMLTHTLLLIKKTFTVSMLCIHRSRFLSVPFLTCESIYQV